MKGGILAGYSTCMVCVVVQEIHCTCTCTCTYIVHDVCIAVYPYHFKCTCTCTYMYMYIKRTVVYARVKRCAEYT